MKLDFDYDTSTGGCHCSLPEQTASYRGYTIRAVHDQDAPNPFEEFDSEPPILVYDGGRRLVGYGLDESFPDMTEAEIRQHAKAIASEVGPGDAPGYRARVREWKQSAPRTLLRAVGRSRDGLESAVDAVNAALIDHAIAMSHGDVLELLRQVYEWKGIPAISVARNGYVQGQWCQVLAVATPEWVELVGAPADSIERQLQSAADLYAAWAWGDCYGWIVEDHDGKEIASCWGYYGSDHETSGLADAAREAIDWEIEKRRRARIEQVKTWIRNRVPLGHRSQEIGDGVFA